MTNKVLLARPNSFLVKNMKKLLAEMSFVPLVIENSDALKHKKYMGFLELSLLQE